MLEDRTLGENKTRMVLVENVASVGKELVTLSCSRDDVSHMRLFITTSFIQQSPGGKAYVTGDAYVFPHMIAETSVSVVDEKNIPLGSLDGHVGMEVQAGDDKVGKLDELVLDPDTGNITHIQGREGHLWGAKRVAIPVSAIRFVDTDNIYLNIDKDAVEALPAVKVKASDWF